MGRCAMRSDSKVDMATTDTDVLMGFIEAHEKMKDEDNDLYCACGGWNDWQSAEPWITHVRILIEKIQYDFVIAAIAAGEDP